MSDTCARDSNLIVQDLIQNGNGIPTGALHPKAVSVATARQTVNRPPAKLKLTFDGPNSPTGMQR